MKFRYYITDTFDGCIKGTDDDSVASECSQCEEYFVVDCETGQWMNTEGAVEISNIVQEG